MERAEREALQRHLERLADGDRAAFDPVFVRLWPLLYGFATRCLPKEEAEDAAQEALLRVFARAAEFDRRRRREDPPGALAAKPDPGRSPEEAAVAADLERELDAALSALRTGDAETLLAYARGERPDLPGPTFRKRVERALARLRAVWRLDHDPRR